MSIITGPRSGLTEPRALVALMAQDLNDLRREQRPADFEALVECGWTRRQIMCFQMQAREVAALTYSETRAPDDERITVRARGVFDPDADQNRPFVAFDRAMRERLAHARASDFDASMRDHLARFEEFQGVPTHAQVEGDA